MVELAVVQQITVLSSLLLAFSFPAVSQLATFNTDRAISKGTGSGDSTGTNTSGRKVSGALVAFIICASSMLVTTFIGLALTLILSHYQNQIPPQKTLDTINALTRMLSWPLLIGIVSFLAAFALLGWIRSYIVGIIATVAGIGSAVLIFVIWGMLSDL